MVFLDIIIFAIIAVVLVLRLRNVLGQRNEDDDKKALRRQMDERYGKTQGQPGNIYSINPNVKDVVPLQLDPLEDTLSADQKSTLAQIQQQDRYFSVSDFMRGANAAFEMIIKAFAEGDKNTLRPLLGKELLEEFSAEIDRRHQHNEVSQVTIIAMPESRITSLSLDKSIASVTVRFVTEQIQLVRDKTTQNIISGDPSRVERIEELWTFSRNLRSDNPNWELTETDAADSL